MDIWEVFWEGCAETELYSTPEKAYESIRDWYCSQIESGGVAEDDKVCYTNALEELERSYNINHDSFGDDNWTWVTKQTVL